MTSISVSSNILIYTLNSNLQTSASIWQHIRKLSFPTEIGPGFNCNSDALWLALLWKLNCLLVIWRNMPTKSVVKVLYEIISVFGIERHESSTHYNEFYFINIVPNFSQLFNSISSLDIRVIPCSDGSHRCWLISCVRLGRIFEIRIWSTRTVNTDISGCSDVRTSVRFAHDSYHCNPRSCSYWFSLQQRS